MTRLLFELVSFYQTLNLYEVLQLKKGENGKIFGGGDRIRSMFHKLSQRYHPYFGTKRYDASFDEGMQQNLIQSEHSHIFSIFRMVLIFQQFTCSRSS